MTNNGLNIDVTLEKQTSKSCADSLTVNISMALARPLRFPSAGPYMV